MIQLLLGDCFEQHWKPIPGFEHYLIFRDGRIFNSRRDQFKKAMPDLKGYMRVRLIDGPRGSTKKVHRLVAQSFLPDFDNSLQVNHLNCIKHDNRVENLEMANQSRNTKHAWFSKRMKLTKKGPDGKFVKC